ncbi:DUF4913 domain-containing protein [Sinomonas sp. ASV486]|uniref:DUF4913 domain-containing protein n=1 Tax=Sinomonas sp. ASV486 TaxID=3051170 RepID=UPI0027DBD6D7|nr:DUF4913 domain-containing protein [Sinomonas sp. ASV486]MDQ4490781.1 DUF4913 domain-containing protein [Sinomonas sp. ASV486]
MSDGLLGEWDDEFTGPAEDAGGAEGAPQLFYPDVARFVGEHLAFVYRRHINPGGGTTWCPQWWKHAEAISRLEALWRAWEHLRLDGTTGMSTWYRDHADHHMAVLLNTDGPFKGCTPEDGHRTRLTPLPCEEPPAGLF